MARGDVPAPPREALEPTLPLAEAKLAAPRVPPGIVERPRIMRALDATPGTTLTLVAAPAGYGKTLAVRQWCAGSDAALAWLTVDSLDEDPLRFWTYVATAVDRVRAGLGRTALQRLRSPGASPDAAVDALLDGLSSLRDDLVLVLDDLDAITDAEAMATIDHALDRLPPTVRVVATARRDPELGIARRRASGTLVELRADQLAFTTPEAQAVLAGRCGAPLAEQDVDVLRRRTEGWPAAVMLAALWLERVPDPERALRRFGGDHRFVGEYLSAEVLDGLDDDVREFLLSAAVLGRATPRLCDAVLERDDSAAKLATLERANLFVVRHERGEWFRIHSLFAEYARVQLVAARPDRAADLHRRACAWLQREGLVVEAAEHAAAAGDYDVLARLLDERHLVLIRNGRARTLLRYVRRLPEDVLARHAALAAATATAVAMTGHGTLERRRLLRLADRGRVELSAADATYVEATVCMVRAAMVEPDVPRAVESGARAVELATAGADDVLIAAYGAYARALFFAGDLVASWAAGMVAIEHPAVERRPPGHVFARVSLSLAAAERRHLGSARHHAEKARQIVGRSHGARTWLGANASVAMGVVLAAEGHVEEAERELSHAEHFFRDDVASIHHAWLLLVLARVRLRRGRLDAAAADLWLAQQEEDELADCGIVRPLAQRVAQDLAAARAQADAGQVTQPPSDAELPVLRLLPSGLSATGIAGVLFLSPNTVRSHMKSIYRKLGVSSRADAVARAEALGLLRSSDSPG